MTETKENDILGFEEKFDPDLQYFPELMEEFQTILDKNIMEQGTELKKEHSEITSEKFLALYRSNDGYTRELQVLINRDKALPVSLLGYFRIEPLRFGRLVKDVNFGDLQEALPQLKKFLDQEEGADFAEEIFESRNVKVQKFTG